MRVLKIVGLALVSAAAAAHAQRGFEIGTFGTFTRFDRTFDLPERIGAGGRLGYMFSDFLGLEVDGVWLGPSAIAGDPSKVLHFGSASLVLNFPAGDRNLFYLLGGYSRMDIGTIAPYNFADNGVHGAIGDRFFVTDRLALRLEARAYYAWETGGPPEWAGHVVGSAGLSFFTGTLRGGPRFFERPVALEPGVPDQDGDGVADGRDACPDTPAGARVDRRGCPPPPPAAREGAPVQPRRAWHRQWFWGGQGGAFFYQTNVQGYGIEPIVGGHWLITANRTALYVAYEQAWFLEDGQTIISDPSSISSSVGPGFRDVSFDDMRRIMFGVLAFPAQKPIEPFIGGGFALMQVLDPIVDCSACDLTELIQAQDRAEDASSKAFFWLMGGISISQGKMSLFGHYILTSASQGFLVRGNTHTFQGGLRYSLGTSKEGITEGR